MMMAPLAFFFSGPFSVLVTAAGAVSVPIIIHLLNRKRFRVVSWAAMRFLLAAQKKNSRRLRLEQLLLLVVRALVVLLVILAMASVTPWAEEFWAAHLPDGGLLSTPGGRRTHRILVLDGSLSMGLKVGDTTCFEKARTLAARLVEESKDNGRGDGFSVILMASPPRTIVGGDAGPAEKLDSVLSELQGLRLPHGNSDLARTLDRVASLLKASPGKFVDKEVYFLTDLQKTSWVLPQPGQVASFLHTLHARARTILVDVGSEEPPRNLALTHLELDLKYPAVPVQVKVPFKAKVHNYGQQTQQPVRVTLLVGRLRGKASDPPYQLHEVSAATHASMQHGENTVSFTHAFDTAGDYVVQARLDGDALPLDDVRSIVVRVRDKVPVLLVNGKPAPELYDQATEYLFDALNPYQDGAPVVSPIRVRKISAAEFSDPGLADLPGQDCVFLCDVPRLSLAEAQRLEAHVKRGGGLVISLGPGAAKNLDSYNDVLYRNGRGLLPARLVGRQEAPKGHYFHFFADDQAFKFPPLAAFELDRDRARLLGAPFSEFVRVELPSSSTAIVSPRKVLSFVARAEKPDQPKSSEAAAYLREPAVIEWQPPLPQKAEGRGPRVSGVQESGGATSSRGRVVLLTSTVNTDWTDWPRQANFVWFMQEVLAHAAAGRLREQSNNVGDILEAYLVGRGSRESGSGAVEQEGKEVTLHTPDGREEKTRTVAREDSVLWRWSDTDISGVYRAVIGSSPEERGFAVNFPVAGLDQHSSESDLKRTSADELRTTYPESEFQIVRDLGQVKRDSKVDTGEAADPQRPLLGTAIARWLLLIALGLMAVEVVLAWYFGHYSAVHERDRAPQGWSRGKYALSLRIGVNVTMVFLLLFTLAAVFTLAHAAWTGDFLGFLPSGFRARVEEALHIPPPAPGEGRRWHLEPLPYLWDAAADPWLVPLLGVALAVLAFLVYRKESRVIGQRPGASRWPAVLMAVLRVGLFLLMLGILLPQLRLWFERQSWPDVVILIDDSASMSVVDEYRDPKVREAADRLAQIAGLSKKERLALAQALIARQGEDWVSALLEQRQVKVHVYRCSERAGRIASASKTEDVADALNEIHSLQAKQSNDSSQLGAAVRQVLNDFRGTSLGAVIMLTDGVTTEGEDLHQVAKYAEQMKVPLFFVGLGDSQEARDLEISELEVADSVFVNDTLRIRFNLTVRGYGERPGPVKVRLRETGSDKELTSKMITVDAASKPKPEELRYKPTTPGIKTYIIDTPVRPDEVDKSNNAKSKEVAVTETKMIRILYVEGYGRWEFRYLKTLLERESKRIKNNKTMDLAVYLVEADKQFALEDENASKLAGPDGDAHLPTRAELNKYDVILLGDVDPAPHDNGNMVRFLKDVASAVRDGGRGLLLIAGERYAPHAYKDSPLRDVLPIDITSDRPPDEPDAGRTESYRPVLTQDGRMHQSFSFNEKDNEPIWKSLREMYWYAEGYQPKPAAYVLAVHPTVKAAGRGTRESGSGSKQEKHPLVVHQFVGSGRTMFLGFHETWRWRWREDEKHYNEFWIQTVRYLARSQQARIELRLNKDKPYQRGEHITVTVRYPSDAPTPAENTDVRVAVLNKDTQEATTLKLAYVKDRRRTFEGVMTRTPVGHYEFTLKSPLVAGGVQPHAEATVIAPPGEMQRTRMNQGEMEEAARESHGRFYTLAEADQLLDDLPSGTRVTLNAPGPPALIWNHALLLVVALLFLSAEWILRKRYHLL